MQQGTTMPSEPNTDRQVFSSRSLVTRAGARHFKDKHRSGQLPRRPALRRSARRACCVFCTRCRCLACCCWAVRVYTFPSLLRSMAASSPEAAARTFVGSRSGVCFNLVCLCFFFVLARCAAFPLPGPLHAVCSQRLPTLKSVAASRSSRLRVLVWALRSGAT